MTIGEKLDVSGWTVLIVDDETPSLEGVRLSVDWQSLGVGVVETAMNIRKAKEIFSRAPIDLMLCDIEMPQGTGIELLEWTRSEYPDTECVFLTCHAEFRYAKEALRLGSLDYLLKPIAYRDLEVVIRKALEKISTARAALADSRDALNWRGSSRIVEERFWLDLAESRIAAGDEAIEACAQSCGMAGQLPSSLSLVCASIRRWHGEYSERSQSILSWAVLRTGEELFASTGKVISVQLKDGSLLFVLPQEEVGPRIPHGAVSGRCSDWIAFASRYLHCELSCYIIVDRPMREVADTVARFRHAEALNVSSGAAIHRLADTEGTDAPGVARSDVEEVALPDMRTWAQMLTSGRSAVLADEIAVLLRRRSSDGSLSLRFLSRFHHDFLQSVYSALKACGIHAHEVFGDDESLALSARATRSEADLIAWVRFALSRAVGMIADKGDGKSALGKARLYMERNLSQELSRDEIAAQAGLNPDYLNRLFKKECGASTMEWLASRRLEYARELLERTDMPISDIASCVGYTNFSHFSAIFREKYALNPSVYRKNLRASS